MATSLTVSELRKVAEVTNQEIVAGRLMRQLHGFAQELGLNEKATRRIVDQVIADLPESEEDELLAEARDWMVIAAG